MTYSGQLSFFSGRLDGQISTTAKNRYHSGTSDIGFTKKAGGRRKEKAFSIEIISTRMSIDFTDHVQRMRNNTDHLF